MNLRGTLARAATAAVALIAGLVLAELLLRLTGVAYPPAILTMRESDFLRLPGIFQPNQHGTDRSIPALAHAVSTDSLGYRGTSFPRAKPAGEVRVFFTGDSFTYGAFVDDSLTVPARLQQQLRAGCREARVINAGLGGSTISEQSEMIQRGLVLDPDIVVLMFYDNDITDLAGPRMWQHLQENRQRKSRFPMSLAYDVLNHTAFWSLFLKAREIRARGDAQAAQPVAVDTAAALRTRAEYVARLRAVADTLAARGIPLVFAVMASHRVVDGSEPAAQVRWILQAADSLGLPSANAVAALQQSGLSTKDLFLLPHDGHASPVANSLIASAIHTVLVRQPLMQTRCHSPG